MDKRVFLIQSDAPAAASAIRITKPAYGRNGLDAAAKGTKTVSKMPLDVDAVSAPRRNP